VSTTAKDFDDRFDGLARLAYRVAFRLTGSRGDAEDISQETLARASIRWPKVEPYAEAWVTRVATNVALGLLRKGSRSPGTASDGERPHDQIVSDRLALVAALRSLPRRQRETVALRFLADLSEIQVAAALGCSVGAVKQHSSRGLAALRRSMDDGNRGPEGELHVRPAR
jgi:RNA polymerase sigma factor (sigma-70 family)